MSLSEYKKKRSFNKTPEPEGHGKRAERGLVFVVQKHDASRLHYDFRIECGGVLLSWAVPKGPSLNPEDKRLAVEVEDHPFDYKDFEGTIPAGNYGAGEVIVWDQGTYEAKPGASRQENERLVREGYGKGRLHIFLRGEKLNGEFALFRTRENYWLLVKSRDEYASDEDVLERNESVLSNKTLVGRKEAVERLEKKRKKREPMPDRFTPMLATLVDEPFDDPGWLFEVKWDGYRAVARIKDGSVDLHSRNLNPLGDDYPEIVEALSRLECDAILDGEIIAYEDGKASFQTLQQRGANKARIEYVVFDILYLDGRTLFDTPLVERKKILQSALPKKSRFIALSEHIEGKGKAYFKAAGKQGLEGIVAKRKDSRYSPGVRSGDWLKIKHVRTDEMVIIGFTEPRKSRKYFGALVLATRKEGRLVFAGHTGTGFDDHALRDLYEKMRPLVTDESPVGEKVPINSPITWIKPRLVAEIKFAEWTDDGRMRQPVFLGLRDDKSASEVRREKKQDTQEVMKQENKRRGAAHEVGITHAEKIYFPEKGYTKGDVISYYESMADFILPYVEGHPHSLNRHPNGIDKPNFFQKNITAEVPPFVRTVKVPSESAGHDINYMVCDNKETLLYMANLGCIEINPWISKADKLDYPDYMVIDLDPGKNTWAELVKTAKTVKKYLDMACEKSYIKTSGKTGLHIAIPMGAKYHFEEIKTFAELIARLVHRELPEITSIERSPAKRTDKIYLDYLQNRVGQTIAAPYSLRPTPEATVSTPIEWRELTEKLDPKKFTIRTIKKRVEKTGDLWKPMLKERTDLKESIKCLREALEK